MSRNLRFAIRRRRLASGTNALGVFMDVHGEWIAADVDAEPAR
jgi:hypothetical protein